MPQKTVTTFEQVLAPMTAQQFFADYWNKTFLHQSGEKGRFVGLFGWTELNRLLEQQRPQSPLFKLNQNGREVDPERYSSRGWGNVQRIDAGRLTACLAAGATLVLDCVEEISPSVRQLSELFCASFRARNYVNVYAGWRRDNGLDLHWDSQDIMILQLSGRKRWQVFAPTRVHPLQGDTDVAPRPTGAPAWEGMLEDGDTLYIPRGWWHIAFPVEEPSLHLTVGTVLPNGLDLLNWAALQLRDHDTVRSDLPTNQSAEARTAHIEKIIALMRDALSDDVVTRFSEAWHAETRARSHMGLPHSVYDQFSPVQRESQVRLASSHRLAFRKRGANAEFKAYNKLYGIPDYLAPVLKHLSDTKPCLVSELMAQLTQDQHRENLLKALSVLARAGVVLIENDKPQA